MHIKQIIYLYAAHNDKHIHMNRVGSMYGSRGVLLVFICQPQ